MFRSFLSSSRAWQIALLLFWAGYGLVAWFLLDRPELMTPDSLGYLHYDAIRTPGYPAFLMAGQPIASPDLFVPFVQLITACASGWFLTCAVARSTGWSAFAIGFAVVIVLNPYFHDHNFTMMTDSFFTSGLNIIAGCFLFYHVRLRARWLLITSLVAGWLIATRPVAWALAPLVPFIVLVYWAALQDRRARMIACCCLIFPCVLVLAAGNAFHRLHHPVAIDHPPILGITAFGKAAMMNKPPPTDVPYSEIADNIQFSMGTRYLVLQQSPDPFHYLQWHADSEAFAQYQILRPEIEQAAARDQRPQTAVMWDIGKAYIMAYPQAYLENVTINWLGFWTIMVDEGLRSPMALLASLATAMMGGISVAIILYGIFAMIIPSQDILRTSNLPWFAPLWLISLFVHGYALLTVLTCVEVTRYIAAIFPLLLLSAAVPLYGAMRYGVLHVLCTRFGKFSLHRQG